MNIKPIKNDVELTNAFIRLESIFQANKGTPKAEEREILVTLIEAYEEEYYPIKVVKSSEILKVKCKRPLSPTFSNSLIPR